MTNSAKMCLPPKSCLGGSQQNEVLLLERATLKSLDSLDSKGPLDPSQPTEQSPAGTQR